MSTVESKLVLSAEDRATATLAKIERATRGSAKALEQYGKAGKASAEVQRLTDALERNKRALGDTQAYDRARAAHASAQASYKMARHSVEQYERALASAKVEAKQFGSVRVAQATAEMAAEAGKAAAAVADLTQKHRAADRVMRTAETAMRAESRALEGARRAMNEYGVPVRSVTGHQQALTRSIDATTAAIRKQNAAEAAAVTAAAAGGARRVVPAVGSAPHPASAVHPRLAVGLPASSVSGLAGVGAGYGAYAGLKKAVTSSMDFERVMIEVKKATDSSGEALKRHGETILKMSRDTGIAKEELGKMYAEMAKSVVPVNEVAQATELTAKAAVAWGVSTDHSAKSLANLKASYQINLNELEKLADAINVTADAGASNESDLLDVLNRVGATGKQIGLTNSQILALAGSMKEVGIQNEVVGTGLQALFNTMKLGEDVSKNAEDGFKALGIDAKKLQKDFAANPFETTIKFLEKLAGVKDKIQRAKIFTDIFGKEYQDDVDRIVNITGRVKELEKQVRATVAAGGKGVAAQFAEQLNTDVSKIDRATRSLEVLAQRIGDPIKVQAGSIAEQINTMVDRLESGDTAFARLAKKITESAGFKPADAKAEKSAWDDPVGAASTWLIQKLDPHFGKSEAERTTIDQQEALDRPGRIEREIAEKRKWLDDGRKVRASGGRSVIDGKEDFTETQIKKLESELAQARAAVAGVLLQRSRAVPGGQVGSGLVNFGVTGPALEQKAAEAAHTLGEGFQQAMRANPLQAESYLADMPAKARKKGEETGHSTGEGIRQGLRAKRPELEDESRFIFEGLRAIFGRGIRIPIGFEPGGGYGVGAGGGGFQKASYDPSAGSPFRRGAVGGYGTGSGGAPAVASHGAIGSVVPLGARAPGGGGDPYAAERAAPGSVTSAPDPIGAEASPGLNAFGGVDPIGGGEAPRREAAAVAASLGPAIAGAARNSFGGVDPLAKASPAAQVPGVGGGASQSTAAGSMFSAGGALADKYPEGLAAGIKQSASDLGINEEDLATLMSFETGGTFDPWKRGPITKHGQHRGLIQWGEPQARQYGVHKDMAPGDQMKAVTQYLYDRGVRPGMDGSRVYAAVNAGGVSDWHLKQRDAAAGGTWGTVLDKWNHQMAGHRVKGRRLLAAEPSGIPFDRKAGDAAMSMPGAPAGPGSFGLDGPKRVEIPELKLPGGAGAPGQAAGNTSSSTHNWGGLTINAAPGQSPDEIARELRRQMDAELRMRRDGSFSDGVA